MKRLVYLFLWIMCVIVLLYLLRIPLSAPTHPTYVTSPLTGKVIVLDPGHGGFDGGADYKDIKEKSITLKTAFYLRDYLQQAGAEVHLTRTKDIDLAPKDMKGFSKRKAYDIRRRVSIIEEKNADLFVSIHLNSLTDGRWRGGQTFYYPGDENESLAKAIQQRIQEVTDTDRQALSATSIYILKRSKTPSALVELGFLSNEQDRERLLEDDFQREIALAIYQGIVEYVHADNMKDDNQVN